MNRKTNPTEEPAQPENGWIEDPASCCGLDCEACSFRVAFLTQDRTHLRAMPERYQ